MISSLSLLYAVFLNDKKILFDHEFHCLVFLQKNQEVLVFDEIKY